ncbi:hypothetical protein [Jannaschia sp. CCS1]|uniref:hypothetical protein n=1 Tax=Jannaschia sp. (strain CCS1) TaxID=290400 RepID=UPI0002FA4A99|nr:hypothetical protein [Jannaschia sp. CCS1]
MRTTFTLTALFAASLAVTGCVNSDLERAGVGAVAGGVTAAAVGGSVVTGAAAGAAVGAVCDEFTRICR